MVGEHPDGHHDHRSLDDQPMAPATVDLLNKAGDLVVVKVVG